MSGLGVLATNNLFAFLAKLLEGGKSVLVGLLVIHFFSPAEFGVYSVAIAVGTVVAVFAEFRLMGILLRLFSQFPSLTRYLVFNAVVINICFACIGVILIALTGLFINNILYQCMVLYSLSFLFKFGRSIRGVLVVRQQNNRVVTIEALSGLLIFISLVIALIYDASIQTIIFIRALDFFVVSVLFAFLIRDLLVKTASHRISSNNNSKTLSLRLMAYLIKKSFPLVLSGAAMLLFQRVDLIFIQAFLSANQAGVYASATTVVSVFCIGAIVLSESLAPKVFKAPKDQQESSKTKDLAFGQTLFVLGALMSLLSYFVSPAVIEVFFGEEYRAAKGVAEILSLTPFAIALGAFSGQLIIKRKLESGVFVKSIVACVTTILLNLWWIPIFGIVGAAWATVFGLFIANYFSHFFIERLKSIFFIQNEVLRGLLLMAMPSLAVTSFYRCIALFNNNKN